MTEEDLTKILEAISSIHYIMAREKAPLFVLLSLAGAYQSLFDYREEISGEMDRKPTVNIATSRGDILKIVAKSRSAQQPPANDGD